MNILIACEESQEVCKAFREKGHNAYSCDIIDCSGGRPEWHIKCDVLEILEPKQYNGCPYEKAIHFTTVTGKRECIPKWDMIIAFPPCTDLAVSGARWFKEKREDGRQAAAIDFFMKFVNADCKKIAIENPIGIMSKQYRKPEQIIQPWQFGHGEQKATCLWLKNLPNLKPTNIVDGREQRVWRMAPGPERAKERSKTFHGIALAMAEQWGKDGEDNDKESIP